MMVSHVFDEALISQRKLNSRQRETGHTPLQKYWNDVVDFPASVICIDTSLGRVLRGPLSSYQMQIKRLESTQRALISLIRQEITRKQTRAGHETAYQAPVPLLLRFKRGKKSLELNAESLHFTCISVASFHIHCGGVQGQKRENCVTVLNSFGGDCGCLSLVFGFTREISKNRPRMVCGRDQKADTSR